MKIRNFVCGALALTALSTAFAGAASATVINFDQRQSGATGSLSYDGNGGALVGKNISFSFVSSDAGDTVSCVDCSLNFTTGSNISEGNTYQFASGGSFELTGSVVDDDGSQIADGSLLSGTFADGGATFVRSSTNNKKGSGTFIGSGSNTVNDDLAAYYDVDLGSLYNFLTTEFSLGGLTFTNNGSFSGSITAADLQSESINDVPEPNELAMFGLGAMLLVGGIAIRSRRSAGRDLIG